MSDWSRIRAVFEELVELDPSLRGPRLDALCGDDATIRSRVERLLAEDTADASVPIELSPAVDLVALDPARVRRIGGYEVVGVLGTGGMGTVFEARQERPQRTVALKVLRTLVASDVARRRLDYEAETLARLRHPNVAQIHESGTWRDPDTGEESPFFAMEFVAGAQPLDQYADSEGLDLDARLALFLDVCDAVHHGHQNGVLHRDLKPANLLVGSDGRPKVIDFGIARATDVVDDDASMNTMTGQVLGTLGYMSPEQLDADPTQIDVRADVYSLGATLYELLVGRTPHERGSDSLPRFVERVKHGLPRRPSMCTATRVRVPAELDWVVLKALAADPDERYASVSELAADLRGFRADEPVSARPLTAGYLLRKFVRRHRLPVAAAAAVLIALVAGTIATAIGWQRAVAAERVSESRRREAEQLVDQLWEVTSFQRNILRDGRGDRNVTLLQVLERARRRLAQKQDSLAGGIGAILHGALGAAFRSLGMSDVSLEQFEKADAQLGGSMDRFPNAALTVRSDYALLLSTLGRYEESEAILREALRRKLELYGDSHYQTAITRTNLASVLAERGDDVAAEQQYGAALPVLVAEMGKQSQFTITTMIGSASTLHRLKRPAEAKALYGEACALALEHFGPEDPDTLEHLATKAVFLMDTGEIAPARATLRQLLPLVKNVRGETHPATMRVLSNIALTFERQERYAEAEQVYRESLELRSDRNGREPVDLITRFNLCVALHRQPEDAKLAEALEHLEALVADAEAVYPADHWRLAVFRQHLGIALRKSGRFADAASALNEARGPLETKLGKTHNRTLSNYRETAELYTAWGRPEEAERWRQRAESR